MQSLWLKNSSCNNLKFLPKILPVLPKLSPWINNVKNESKPFKKKCRYRMKVTSEIFECFIQKYVAISWQSSVRTLSSHCKNWGSIPVQGTKISTNWVKGKEREREVCCEIHFQIYLLWHNILYSENMRIYIYINLYFFKCKSYKGRDYVSFVTSHETQLELNKYW